MWNNNVELIPTERFFFQPVKMCTTLHNAGDGRPLVNAVRILYGWRWTALRAVLFAVSKIQVNFWQIPLTSLVHGKSTVWNETTEVEGKYGHTYLHSLPVAVTTPKEGYS